MLTGRQWAQCADVAARPWLILGKGPSYAKFRADESSAYALLALNHVARDIKCDAALMMDYDVFDACAEALARNARYLLMPWRPHFNYGASDRTLAQLVRQDPRLAAFAAEDRLVWFNAQTAVDFAPHAGEPITGVVYFSAEAALNILADNGAATVRTLGVDGGGRYAGAFDYLSRSTLLANGLPNFDRQFSQFALTLRRHPNLLFGPLDVQTPARFFIGADSTQRLGARLFEYSVRRFASLSTTFEVIDNEGLPTPRDKDRQARTGFSFSRFKIPQLCNRRGRAVYVDADMQVFADIRDLWTREFGDAWLLYSEQDGASGRIPQFSVMLLDCAALDWDAAALVAALDRGEYDYKALMHDFAMMPADRKKPALETAWNSLETYVEGETKLIHYTDMPTQPWVSNKNRNGELWYRELRRAIDDGFITRAEVDEEIARGHVSPMLPQWAGLTAHPNAAKLASKWSAPFQRFLRRTA